MNTFTFKVHFADNTFVNLNDGLSLRIEFTAESEYFFLNCVYMSFLFGFGSCIEKDSPSFLFL